MGKKTQRNFLNIEIPKIEQKILLYSFTRKSSTPLDQEIPRHRPKTLLDILQDLRTAELGGEYPNEALASLLNSGLANL
jgi:hypothetical protein